jgi:hypothetical protein
VMRGQPVGEARDAEHVGVAVARAELGVHGAAERREAQGRGSTLRLRSNASKRLR